MPTCVKCGKMFVCTCGAPRPLGSAVQGCPLKKGGIWIHVTDDSGLDVDHVGVSVDSVSKSTGPAGISTFDPLDPKGYTVTLKPLTLPVSEKHDLPATTVEQVTVSNGEITYVGFELKRKAKLKVKVVKRGETSKVFTGAKVQVTGAQGAAELVTGGAEGVADYGWQSAGAYPIGLTLAEGDDKEFVRTEGNLEVQLLPGEEELVYLEVRPRPAPKIEIDEPRIVLVKRAYHGKDKPGVKPHRVKVKLTAVEEFDGEGKFTFPADSLNVYEKEDGKETDAVQSPFVVKNEDLGGKTLYIEAIKESSGNEKTELKFELVNGSVAAKPAVVEKITCVKVELEIYKSRPADGGDPVKYTDNDRWDSGRPVLEQGTDEKQLWAERAMLVVKQALPADFAGKVILQPITDGVELFAETEEKPDKAHTAIDPKTLKFDNAAIDSAKGKKFWVQGKTLSASLSDTGWIVGVDGVTDGANQLVEGDRVAMTVIKAELLIHKSRAVVKADGDPAAFSNDDKLTKARYLHKQDGKGHHGRGMITVKKIKPDGFAGKLFFTAWKVGYDPNYSESIVKADQPVKIFEEEDASGATQTAVAFDSDIDHPKTFPDKGKQYWVEGVKTSTELRDIQIRLGVRDVDKGCDRGNFTVVRFKKLIVDIPSTPANTVRNTITGGGSNSPVKRHELKMADPDPADKECSELFSENEPLVLVEGSVTDADPVKLSVEVEPAGKSIPVKWSVQRFSHKAHAEGDPDAIINLANNSADPGLTADPGDVLKATLKLNAAGSFHVRPFVDCNDDDKFNHNDDNGVRIDREPFLLMNLQLIRVEGMSNLTDGKDDAGTNGTEKAMTALGPPFGTKNVPVRISTGNTPWTNGACAITMKNIARVIGGGSDGKRGLDKLFSGWCNNMQNTATSPTGAGLDITHIYEKAGAPPARHTTACWFEVDAVRIPAPILDAGAYGPANTEGTGGNTATGTNGTNDCPVTKLDHASGIGQSWEVSNVDAPGFGINAMHPTVAGAKLVEFRFNIDFRCDFVFWTNKDGVSDNTDAPACRLYSTVSTNYWTVRFEATYDAGFVETVVVGPLNRVVKDPNETRRATPVAGSALETRLPDSLDTLKTHQTP